MIRKTPIKRLPKFTKGETVYFDFDKWNRRFPNRRGYRFILEIQQDSPESDIHFTGKAIISEDATVPVDSSFDCFEKKWFYAA